MKKLYQTKYGEEGNCFAACVASLFEIGIDEVPFLGKDEEWEDYELRLNSFLSKFQLKITTFHLTSSDCQEFIQDFFADTYIITGYSTSINLEHAVITLNGEVVHNPNDKNDFELLEPQYAFGFMRVFR